MTDSMVDVKIWGQARSQILQLPLSDDLFEPQTPANEATDT